MDRLTRLGEKIESIHDILSGSYRFDRLAVFLLGDVNDGTDIYAGQAHEQAESNVEAQAAQLAGVLTGWFGRQAETWGKVDVYPVAGNHGRVGKFAHLGASWDRVCYRYVQMSARKGVEVHMPGDGELFLRKVDLRGHRYLLYHGHGIRMYQSIAWYGITQRVMRWMTTASIGPVDVACFGHFHHCGCMPVNSKTVFLTGTPVTDDQWALTDLGLEDTPRWWFFGAGDERPVTWEYRLDLA